MFKTIVFGLVLGFPIEALAFGPFPPPPCPGCIGGGPMPVPVRMEQERQQRQRVARIYQMEQQRDAEIQQRAYAIRKERAERFSSVRGSSEEADPGFVTRREVTKGNREPEPIDDADWIDEIIELKARAAAKPAAPARPPVARTAPATTPTWLLVAASALVGVFIGRRWWR